MPISPGTTLPIFQSMLASHGIAGTFSSQLAFGLSTGLFQYLTVAVSVNTNDVGTLGSGTGIGTSLALPSSVIQSTLGPSLIGHSIAGQYASSLSDAISLAISTSLSGALVQTINVGVGVGTGKITISSLGRGGLIWGGALSQIGFTGLLAPSLGDAIGTALDLVISSTTGLVAIVGSPSTVSSTGFGTGKII